MDLLDFPLSRRRLCIDAWAATTTSLCASPLMNRTSHREGRRHDWLPTECAPRGYPVHVIRGTLILQNGDVAAVPDGRTTRNDWGKWGSTHAVGPALKALPQSLDLWWISWTENQAYRATFALPIDLIASWFRSKLPVPRYERYAEFNGVVVGMAPYGLAVVWLAAVSERLEIAAHHGQKVDIDWKAQFPSASLDRPGLVKATLQAELTPAQLDQLGSHGVPKGLFESYRQLFRWTPWVTGSEVPSTMAIVSFNGEDAYIGARGPCIPRDTRPVPRMIEIDWTNHRQERRSADVHFNEAEIFAAFRFLSDSQPDAPLQLHLETLADHVDVSLRDQHRRVLLRKTEVTLFKV